MSSLQELITEVKLVQAGMDVTAEALEKTFIRLQTQEEKAGQLKIEIALIRQKQEAQEVKLDDLIRCVIRGTTKDESLISQLRTLRHDQQESSKNQRDNKANRLVIIGIAVALLGSLSALAAVVLQAITK